MANAFIARPQFGIGLVHFFCAFRSARYRSLKAASSEGNEARILSVFRRLLLSDSMLLVV